MVLLSGTVSFYATIWESIRKIVYEHGWGAGLHGSLSRDMDIIAIPWSEDAINADTLIDIIIEKCFENNILAKYGKQVIRNSKPHGRICYAIPITEELYLDISIMDPRENNNNTNNTE